MNSSTKKDTDKDHARKSLLLLRSQLSAALQQQKSAQIIDHIKKSDVLNSAKNIAYFHAVRGEANPAELANVAPKHTQFYLPVIAPNKNEGLLFAPINQDTEFKNNQFSIPEPIVDSSEMINARDLDLVIMPLLGFDNSGNRLGMGGGYYDRCFAFKKDKELKPILLGFSYDFQEIGPISTEPWDIGLDMIATESALIRF